MLPIDVDLSPEEPDSYYPSECPYCDELKTTIKRRRRNTAYCDPERNFSFGCLDCAKEDDAHYAELWADYRGSI